MTLREFIYHLAHKSISIQLMVYDYNNKALVRIFDGSVGTLIHWKDFPKYSDYVVESINPDHNFFEVRIYG